VPLAQVLFTPLLAGWSIWVGIAISCRSSDVRVAQQLGTLASVPPLAIVALMSFRVIHPTVALVVALGVGLLVIDAMEVHGLRSERMGELTLEAGLVLYELTPLSVSLEDAFMDITHEAVEYQTGSNGHSDPATVPELAGQTS